MTEKRFTVPMNYRCIQDNLTKEHYLCEDKTEAINLTYLLNELHEEKEMWKRECERLKGLYYFENEKDEHLAWKRVDVR